MPGVIPPAFDLASWATSAAELVPIEDGHLFELGNRTLQAIAVPGHTPGSICLLDRRHRLLFAGDTILPFAMALYFEECLPLSEFHRHLRRLQGSAEEFDLLLARDAQASVYAALAPPPHSVAT